MNRLMPAAVAVVVLLIAGISALSYLGYREHKRNEAYQAYVQQFPGKGVFSRRQYDIFEQERKAHNRVTEERFKEGMRLRLPKAEFERRFDIVCAAAMEESRRVRRSDWTVPFNAKVVPDMKDIPPPVP